VGEERYGREEVWERRGMEEKRDGEERYGREEVWERRGKEEGWDRRGMARRGTVRNGRQERNGREERKGEKGAARDEG
jgi:hypothetical protein